MVRAERPTRRRTPVHLSVDQRGVGDDARLLHLEPEVGALTGPLPHAGEHRHAAVLAGHPDDHLLDHDGLAHAGPAEEADLPAEHVGLEQVDHLEAGLEHLGLGVEVLEGGRRAVDLPLVGDVLGDRLAAGVEGLADDVEHVAEGALAHRHGDATAQVAHRRAPHQPVGRLHGDRPHPAVTDVLGHLGHDGRLLALGLHRELQGEVDLGEGVRRELHVDHRADDGHDAPVLEGGLCPGGVGVGDGHRCSCLCSLRSRSRRSRCLR
jgi:hypothetical protein